MLSVKFAWFQKVTAKTGTTSLETKRMVTSGYEPVHAAVASTVEVQRNLVQELTKGA